jgi:hypothetical protein
MIFCIDGSPLLITFRLLSTHHPCTTWQINKRVIEKVLLIATNQTNRLILLIFEVKRLTRKMVAAMVGKKSLKIPKG